MSGFFLPHYTIILLLLLRCKNNDTVAFCLGPKGPPGDTGPLGVDGIFGVRGRRGPTGLIGLPGATGNTGPTGHNDASGMQPGPPGFTGGTGPKGARGKNECMLYNFQQSSTEIALLKIRSTLCPRKLPPFYFLITLSKLTNFNDFWCVKFR